MTGYQPYMPKDADELLTSNDLQFNVIYEISDDLLSLTLYRNSSEINRIDKTSFLEVDVKMYGTLKNECSLIRPIITFESVDPPQFNYVYIPNFKRYYYLVALTSVSKNIWRMELNCDVLMSYKNEILDLSGYVTRSESHPVIDLMDNTYPQKVVYDSKVLDFRVYDNTWLTENRYTEQDYLLQFQGLFRDDNDNNVPFALPIPTLTTNISNVKTTLSYLYTITNLLGGKTPADCLVNVYSLPFQVKRDDRAVYKLDVPGVFSTDLILPTAMYQPRQLFQDIYFELNISKYLESDPNKSYLNTTPYTKLSLEFNPFGTFDIPYSDLYITKKLTLKVSVNILTGDAKLMQSCDTIDSVKYKYLSSSNVSIRYPYATNTYNLNALQQISGVASLMAGIITKNPLIMSGSLVHVASNITNALNPSTTTSVGANQFIDSPRLFIYKQKQQPSSPTLYGYPCFEYLNLNTLDGYAEIEKIHLENLKTATVDEITEIENILKSGVIF